MTLHQTPRRVFSGAAERVKSRRIELGLSLQVAATRAGMSMNRWRDVEQHGLATATTLSLISAALELNLDDLVQPQGVAR